MSHSNACSWCLDQSWITSLQNQIQICTCVFISSPTPSPPCVHSPRPIREERKGCLLRVGNSALLQVPTFLSEQGQELQGVSEVWHVILKHDLEEETASHRDLHPLSAPVCCYLALIALFQQSPGSIQHAQVTLLHLQAPQSQRDLGVGW